MSTIPDPEGKIRSVKSRAYLVIAALLLLTMALVWSLDASIVYITLGGAIFFIFLAIWNRPRVSSTTKQYATHERVRRPGESLPFDNLKDLFFKKKPAHQQQQQAHQPSQTPQNKRTAKAAYFFIFFVFTLIFSAAVFLDSESYSEEAIAYFDRAEQFRWSGEYDSAERYYQLALSVEPDYPEALTGYGSALLGNNKYDAALGVLDQALIINPDYENASYTKALVYYYQKKYEQSRNELFRLLDRSPEHYDAMILAGDDYYMQQKNDSAIYWYEAGYNNGVRSAPLCHVMAYLYDEKGEDQKAIPLYQEALQYDSTKLDVYTRLGELFPGKEGDVYRSAFRKLKEQGY
jgi:tetratricopeptide (TPR) repeat protein